jgi:hypothetical protein
MDANLIGKRGENMFATLIMEPWHRPEPLFAPTFFGDKFPGLDHYSNLSAPRYAVIFSCR